MNKFFIIPVDSAIQEFREHLKCHPRSILSARYGDVKSYFIDAFMKDPAVKKEFQFPIKLPAAKSGGHSAPENETHAQRKNSGRGGSHLAK